MEDKVRNVVIIGSGPAGYTAAIYSARAMLAPLLITGLQVGGQLIITTEVENYPGFPKGIQGPDLMTEMRVQAERFSTEIIDDEVTAVDFSKQPFEVEVGMERIIRSKTVIVATGATARRLSLPSEEKFWGRGVSACATCDGFFFKGKDIMVVGGGDTAIEEALYLTHFAANLSIIHRRDRLRASAIMQQKALDNKSIKFIWNSEVVEILGDKEPPRVTGVRLRNTVTGEVSDRPCGGVFLAIGHTPNTTLFEGQLDMDAKGFLITKPRSTATNIPGVFAAGDVQDSYYRQAVTAAGSGCMAAIDAERYLG